MVGGRRERPTRPRHDTGIAGNAPSTGLPPSITHPLGAGQCWDTTCSARPHLPRACQQPAPQPRRRRRRLLPRQLPLQPKLQQHTFHHYLCSNPVSRAPPPAAAAAAGKALMALLCPSITHPLGAAARAPPSPHPACLTVPKRLRQRRLQLPGQARLHRQGSSRAPAMTSLA